MLSPNDQFIARLNQVQFPADYVGLFSNFLKASPATALVQAQADGMIADINQIVSMITVDGKINWQPLPNFNNTSVSIYNSFKSLLSKMGFPFPNPSYPKNIEVLPNTFDDVIANDYFFVINVRMGTIVGNMEFVFGAATLVNIATLKNITYVPKSGETITPQVCNFGTAVTWTKP